MNSKQKEILEKEREEHPTEVAFIELMDACGAYRKVKKQSGNIEI